jgi:hypothetical protein
LPDGTIGTAYPTTTFSATGGHPPYTWSTPQSADTSQTQLPVGLNLSSEGVLDGTPTADNAPGIYDFAITVTDSSGPPPYSPGRTVTLNYTITIH